VGPTRCLFTSRRVYCTNDSPGTSRLELRSNDLTVRSFDLEPGPDSVIYKTYLAVMYLYHLRHPMEASHRQL